jgi:hypothetical protein
MRPAWAAPLLAALAVAPAALAAGTEEFSVRVSPAVAPCVEAAARAYPGPGRPRLETGRLKEGAPLVIVGSSVEVDRVLESDGALHDTDVDVARIPWVLTVAPGQDAPPQGLAGLAASSAGVAVLGGPEAYAARRALRGVPERRVREATEAAVLQNAPLALVPLSLAAPGEQMSTDVPPLRVRAAVGKAGASSPAARAFVQFLAGPPGQAAFAACGVTR